jgi:chloramphenicol 3-O-phosphotransferase
LVDIVLGIGDLSITARSLSIRTFANIGEELGHDDKLLAWDLVLFDCLCDNLLGFTVAVDVC